MAVAALGSGTRGRADRSRLDGWIEAGRVPASRRVTAAVLVVALVASVLAVLPWLPRAAAPVAEAGTATELTAAEQASVASQMAEGARYFHGGTTPGTLAVANADVGITATLSAAALRVATASRGDAVALTTLAFGRAAAIVPLPRGAAPVHTDTAATISRGPIVEWFRNTAGGLEQGWTVASRPAGTGPLALDLGVDGKVTLAGPDAARLQAADGSSLSYAGLTAIDARGRDLAAHLVATAAGLRILVDDAAAAYPIVIDPTITSTVDVEGIADSSLDLMGSSVAVDGRWMVSGAPGDQLASGGSINVGSIYVYFDQTGNGDWHLVDQLLPPAGIGTTPPQLGSSVAIQVEPAGVTVAAGLTQVLSASGRIAVWTYPGDPVTVAPAVHPAAPLVLAPNAYPGRNIQQYGSAMAFDGDHLVVGIPQTGTANIIVPDGPDAGTAPDAINEAVGIVDVLHRTAGFGSTFTLEQRIDAPDAGLQTTDNDQRDIQQEFGFDVAIDGDLLAIGARGDDGQLTLTGSTSGVGTPRQNQTSLYKGAAYLYRLQGGTWTEAQKIRPSNLVDQAQLGFSVALADGDLLVGAPGSNANAGTYPGRALLYDRTGSDTWAQTAELSADDPSTTANEAAQNNQRFGISVDSAAGGTRLLVSASQQTTPGQSGSGAVLQYDRATTAGTSTPAMVQKIVPPAPPAGESAAQWYGQSIAATDQSLVVGAPRRADGTGTWTGATFTYQRTTSRYTDHAGRVDPTGGRFDAFFGTVLAQSDDVLVVTAPGERRAQDAIGTGAVYVFTRQGGAWVLDEVLYPSALHNVGSGTAPAYARSVAVQVKRDAAGHDIGLVVAIGAPGDRTFNLEGNGVNISTGPVGSGTVGIYGRNGGPGTAFTSYRELWSGGQSGGPGTPGPAGHPTTNGFFGQAVAFTADGTLVVGEPGANAGAGAIHRYENTGTVSVWTAQQDVTGPAGATGFGAAVAADGTQVAALATAANATPRVAVLRDGSATTNLQPLTTFGASVSTSMNLGLDIVGQRIALGAPADDVVRIYRSPGDGVPYSLEETLHGTSGTGFGVSVALSRGTAQLSIAVGAPGATIATHSGAAAVYVARVRTDGRAVWGTANDLQPTSGGNAVGAGFGLAVTNWPDDGGVLVSAPSLDVPAIDAGHVYGFTTSGLAPPVIPEAFVDVTAPAVVPVGASQLPTSGLTPSLLANNAQASGSIAAAPLSGIDLSKPPTGTSVAASPLSGIPLSGIPLSGIPLSGIPLSGIPLSGIAGGWDTVLDGTPYDGVPLQSVQLKDVYDLPSVQALTLGAIDLSGTPLSGIPLSGIALGAVPLSGIAIGDSADPLDDWCDLLADLHVTPGSVGLDCAHHAAAANDAVNLVSLALQGVPLSGIPLSGIPLSGIPLSGIPLSGIPLSGIDLAGSPLSGIPLSGIPLSGIPLSGIPLSGIPLSGIPLSGIPLSGIPLSGIPLSGIPLSGIDLAGSPLSGIPLSGIPLSGIPLSGIPLSGIPLSGIPLSGIPLSGIQLGGTPLSGIPLSGIDLVGTPLSGIPLSGIPLSGIPLSGIPLSGIPLSGIPLSGIPLSGIDLAGTPLSGIPLSALVDPVSGAVRAKTIGAIPLSGIGDLAAVVDCAKVDCARPGTTLGDAARAGALKTGAKIGDLDGALDGVHLGDLVGNLTGATADALGAAIQNLTLADATHLGKFTLGDVPQIHAYLTLGQLASVLDGFRLGDIADRIDGFTSADVVAALSAAHLSLADLSTFDDVTLGELTAVQALLHLGDLEPVLGTIRLGDLADRITKPGGGRYTQAELRSALTGALGGSATLDDLDDLGNLTLGELGQYGGTTVGQLLGALPSDILDGITLGDVLLTLIARSQYPWEQLDLQQVTAQALDGATHAVPISVAFSAQAPDGHARTVRLELRLPAGSALAPGSVTTTLPVPAADLVPETLDGALVWTFTDVPANAVNTLTFQMEPTVTVGSGQVQAVATLQEDDTSASDRADLRTTEVLEPNDTLAQATALPDDTIVLSHVSTADDLDLYKFDVTQPGTRVSINLSNLDADLDAVLYSPKASSATIQDPSPRSITPVEDEAASGSGLAVVPPEPADDLSSPAALGQLAVNQASINRGPHDEQIDTGVLQRSGTYYLAISGYNGATNRQPYALRLKRLATPTQPACPARSVPTGTIGSALPASLPAGTDTVFVVNRSRLEGLYGAAATQPLLTSLTNLVTYLNAPAQDGLGVTAAVLNVDADAGVRSAYAAWDAHPCLPEGANGVVSEVVRVLDQYRNAGTTLKHVVVVGGDDVVPFARVPDRTEVANEGGYASTFSDAGNALFATFSTSHLLTDDAYGDLDPYGFGDRVLFVADSAVGRLVETPTEIKDQLDDFVAAHGKLAVGTGLVTGYDFLTDGATEVSDSLDQTYGNVDDSLISEDWTRQDLEAAIHSIKPDVAAINAHFDHYRALPGAGNATGDESDLFTAAAVRGSLAGDLARAVVFSMGCHGGLSASDKLLTGARALDFAQAISSQGGVFVGNTGYGYGDTELVALSERLMQLFAQRLDGAMSVGEALQYAKASYAGDLTAYGVYDEKVLMESTFYGLPFYRLDVTNPPPLPPKPPTPQISTDPIAGVDTAHLEVTPVTEEREGPNGETYYVSVDDEGTDDATMVHDRPVEPRTEVAFSAPAGREAHDALVTGLTTTDEHGVDPYVFEPLVDSGDERSDQPSDVVFPSSPVRVNPVQTPTGETYNLAATTGYFRTTSTDGTGIQRLIDQLDVAPYFAPGTSTDFTRPTFGLVDAAVDGGVLTLTTSVTDDQGGAGGVRRVYVLAVEDPAAGASTTWRSLDLVRTPGTDRWSGSMAVTGDEVEYLVQAVDAAGNVGITTNKALNFRDAAAPLDPPHTDLGVTVAGTTGSDGWYRAAVTVTATGGTGLSYEVVGVTPETPYTGPVSVPGDGVRTIVIRSSDGQRATRTIRIDTQGPTAAISAPAANAVLRQGTGVEAGYGCLDAGSGTTFCTATLDGHLVTAGTDLTATAGTHTLVVTTGADRAGNAPVTAGASRTFTVVPAPHVTSVAVDGPSVAGQPTTVVAQYTGHSVGTPYTAVVAWGDGTTSTCTTAATSAGCQITMAANGQGTVQSTHTYAGAPTGRTATVTVTDRLGGSDSGSVAFNKTTALAATPVLVKVSLLGGITIQTGSISATLTDEDGHPLSGRTITFATKAGAALCTATSNASGRAACPPSLGLTLAAVLAGSYTAKYAGDGSYLAISASGPIVKVL